MHWYLIFLGIALTATRSHGNQQIQMPEAGAFVLDEDLAEQIDRLKQNVTELWMNFRTLKSVLTETLNHLRVHQAELEETVHMLEHKHEDGGSFHGSYTDDHHHHSGEQHGDSHGHGDDHHHSNEQHSHGDDHSHGDHTHGDDHSHGDHSHSGEQHGHGGEEHFHQSYSHSYSSASHAGHHHDDSHEKGDDDFQQTQKEDSPMIEPLVVASSAHQHYHQQKPLSAISNSLLLINDSTFNSHHHHHNHRRGHGGRSERNRTVTIPKFSEVGVYDFAVCNVQPNRAIPEDQQQDITGRINLWQRKSGGPLNIHIRLQGFDVGGHHGHHDDHQSVQQEQQEDNETPTSAGHRHGFHIHASGDLSNGCQSAGPHFNPKNVNHGSPSALVRHVGDLGNIECDEHGNANILFNDDIASLKGPYSIIGKSIVIHAGQDDLGLGGNDESLRTGNAGARLACCVIEKVDKLPFRAFKFLKTATQYNNAQ